MLICGIRVIKSLIYSLISLILWVLPELSPIRFPGPEGGLGVAVELPLGQQMIESLPEYEHMSGLPLANASGHSCASLQVPICLVADTRHESPAKEKKIRYN